MGFIRRLAKSMYRILNPPKSPLRISQFYREKGYKIGPDTAIYPNVILGNGDNISIGANCCLTGCTILGHDASTNLALGYRLGEGGSIKMPVVIEDNCFIGHGAIVLMGVTIGQNSIVGAGSVVSKDVPPNSVVVGNPARVICTTDELVEKRQKLLAEHPEFQGPRKKSPYYP